ncbi:hypothetical protein CPB83DRAFT_904393 [Crepidotus variabilis]|uniref:F-box domain-containing protein n=1 Tax=Crepidotus variabilis TaxID=179855 RepID=A0A9P6EMY9_9AGAR|nr:hypothetical protein CPB83DRAFT_904393 [Crepidotus variabilis]
MNMDVDPDFEKDSPANFRHEVDLRIQHHHDEIRRLKSLRNISSPMSRLSVELFSAIVEFCQSGSQEPGWIRLAQVCSHWRQVMIQRPSLWTKISLSSMEAASTMLERSGTAGISVCWTAPALPPRQFRHLPLRPEATAYYHRPLTIANFVLRNALSRIKSFAIFGPSSGDHCPCPESEIQQRLLEHLEPGPIPRLQKLTILLWNSKPLQPQQERSPDQDLITFFEQCAGITPLSISPLAELRVSYIASWNSPLLRTNLKKCTIEYCDVQPSMREFALAIRRMSSLLKLSAGSSRDIHFRRPCLPSPNSDSVPLPHLDNPRSTTNSNILDNIQLCGPLPNINYILQYMDLRHISKISISAIRDKSSGPFTELFSQLARKYEVYSIKRPSFQYIWLTLYNYGIEFEATQLSLELPLETTGQVGISSREQLRKFRLTLNLNWGPLPEDDGEELQSTLLDLACVSPMTRLLSLSIIINERIPATTIHQVLGPQPKLHSLELTGSLLDSFIEFLTPEDDADTINLPLLRILCISEGRFRRSRTAWVPFQNLVDCLQKRFHKGSVLQSLDLSGSYGLQNGDIYRLHSLVEKIEWSSDETMDIGSSEHFGEDSL